MRELLIGKRAANRVADERQDAAWIEPRTVISEEALALVPRRRWNEVQLEDGKVQDQIDRIFQSVEEQGNVIKAVFDEKIARLKKGDELPPGVFKMVKVYLAIKRKLSVGDKMAGRHGNKGVISRILPEEDMPYVADGTPVDIVLNPLGVPSRMNIGQILETHLGWAAHGLGEQIDTVLRNGVGGDPKAVRTALQNAYSDPNISTALDQASDDAVMDLATSVRKGVHVATAVFDGAKEDEIRNELDRAGLPLTGQTVLFDGRTGEPFDHDVTVGVLYMLKLHTWPTTRSTRGASGPTAW